MEPRRQDSGENGRWGEQVDLREKVTPGYSEVSWPRKLNDGVGQTKRVYVRKATCK